MMASGYEQLLKMELAPEQMEGPKLGGKIDTVRIVF